MRLWQLRTCHRLWTSQFVKSCSIHYERGSRSICVQICHAFSVAGDLQTLLEFSVMLYIFKESKQLFDAMKKRKAYAERPLMSEIMAVRHADCPFGISEIGLFWKHLTIFCPNKPNFSNRVNLAGKGKNDWALRNLLVMEKDVVDLVQWIEKNILPTRTPFYRKMVEVWKHQCLAVLTKHEQTTRKCQQCRI